MTRCPLPLRRPTPHEQAPDSDRVAAPGYTADDNRAADGTYAYEWDGEIRLRPAARFVRRLGPRRTGRQKKIGDE
jgi:hypothetical protein